MATIPFSKIFKLDWRWVGLSFCFFITFNLLPSHIIYLLRIVSPASTTVYSIWIFGGIALIALAIGYSSKGVTIWEPAVASAVYAPILLSAIRTVWNRGIQVWTPYWIIAIIAAAALSAWLGEFIQAMKQRNEARKNP